MAWSRPVEWWSRMAASIAELAYEQYEELLGYRYGEVVDLAPSEGHKPMRPDIARLKQFYDIKNGTYDSDSGTVGPPRDPDKAEQWKDLTELNPDEREAYLLYQELDNDSIQQNSGYISADDDIFELTTRLISDDENLANDLRLPMNRRPQGGVYSLDEAKSILSGALRKKQITEAPKTYSDIRSTLSNLLQNAPESYKMWPWVVKQLKNGSVSPSHLYDVVAAGGKVLNELRQQNKLPANLDVNQMSFDDFENWFMEWKRDNREAESQGEVVYKYDDGYTIQRLKTPEQLQFEGDEMAHCVGNYDGPVNSGASIIYSLRDSKGNPHVTIEVEGRRTEFQNTDSNMVYEDRLHASEQYRAPHDEKPIEGEEQAERPTYDVVQVMGKGNYEPKPVYQNKIYEFLNSLRRQYGIVFQKSPGWHTPYDVDDDDPRWNADRDGYGNYDPDNDLVSSDIWWNYYKNEPDQFHEDNVDGQYNLVIPKRRTGLFPKDKQQSPYGGGVYDSPEDMMRSAISQMMSPLGHTDWHEEALTVFHAMQVDGYSTDEMTKAWDDAATYLTSMLQSAQEDRSWGAGNDDAQRYMAYLLQLLQYTKEPDYKHEARMSVPGYDYQMLDPDETFTGPSSWEGDIAPNWPPAIPGTFSKIAEKEYASDPEYVYVYYMSELMVEPWEVNIRYERMLDQLLNKFGIDSMTLLDPSQVDAGEIRTSGDILHIEHKQLSDPEVRYYAERALEDWWAQERPKLKIFDWYEETPWKTLDPQQATDT